MVAEMREEVVMVAVILIVLQTEMVVQITVMTGNALSVKIAISLSVQNVIAVV